MDNEEDGIEIVKPNLEPEKKSGNFLKFFLQFWKLTLFFLTCIINNRQTTTFNNGIIPDFIEQKTKNAFYLFCFLFNKIWKNAIIEIGR